MKILNFIANIFRSLFPMLFASQLMPLTGGAMLRHGLYFPRGRYKFPDYSNGKTRSKKTNRLAMRTRAKRR